jgi:hypothetical protein
MSNVERATYELAKEGNGYRILKVAKQANGLPPRWWTASLLLTEAQAAHRLSDWGVPDDEQSRLFQAARSH